MTYKHKHKREYNNTWLIHIDLHIITAIVTHTHTHTHTGVTSNFACVSLCTGSPPVPLPTVQMRMGENWYRDLDDRLRVCA